MFHPDLINTDALKKKGSKQIIPFEKYLLIEENESTRIISFSSSFRKILDQKQIELFKKLSKKIPFLTMNEEWNTILSSPQPDKVSSKDLKAIKEYIKENFSSSLCKFKLTGLKKELDFIKSEKKSDKIKEFITKMAKKFKYFRRSNQHMSFYKALGYGYIEQMMIDGAPFKFMLNILKKIKSNTFELKNPFTENLENSCLTYIQDVKNYLESNLRIIASKMFQIERNKDFKVLMAGQFQEMMSEDDLFQLLILALMKSLVFERCLQDKIARDATDNLQKGVFEFKNIEIVCKALNIKIRVMGYEKKNGVFEKIKEKFGEGLKNPDFSLSLYYCDGVYHLTYGQDFPEKIIDSFGE